MQQPALQFLRASFLATKLWPGRSHETDWIHKVNVEQEVIKTLRAVLNLDSGRHKLDAGTALLGSVAELDSMAVVSILTALEDRFGFAVDDDEVDGHTFASVGSLVTFIQSKLSQ